MLSISKIYNPCLKKEKFRTLEKKRERSLINPLQIKCSIRQLTETAVYENLTFRGVKGGH